MEINKTILKDEIRKKLNLHKNQDENLYLIDFNINIGKILSLIKINSINKKIGENLIDNLKNLKLDKSNQYLISQSFKLLELI